MDLLERPGTKASCEVLLLPIILGRRVTDYIREVNLSEMPPRNTRKHKEKNPSLTTTSFFPSRDPRGKLLTLKRGSILLQ